MARTYADVRRCLDVLVDEEGLRRTLAGMAWACLTIIEQKELPVPRLTWHAEGVVFIWEVAESRLLMTMTDDNHHPSLIYEYEDGSSFRRDDRYYWFSDLAIFFRKPLP